MKLLTILCFLLTMAIAGECPAKLLQKATKGVKNYFQGYYKKVGNIKINCSYDHDSNIFNIEHHIKGDAVFKKRKLNFDVKAHSGMFNLYNFSDLDGKICHSKIEGARGVKDVNLIKKSFLKKFAKNIKDKDIHTKERNGQTCYMAKIAKKARRSMI